MNRAKLSRYKIIKTGSIVEVFEYQRPFSYNMNVVKVVSEKVQKEGRRIDHIMRAQGDIRRLVNANSKVFGFKPIFVTYTFADNITDIKEATYMFSQHMRALKLRIGKPLRYLAVPEIQEQRALKYGVEVWHFHVVFFDMPFIYGIKNLFSEEWQHGWVKVHSVRHVRNVGAYVSKYFSKQWASGRPRHCKSYFTSLGLLQPVITYNDEELIHLRLSSRVVCEYQSAYETERYGTIKYTQYRDLSFEQLQNIKNHDNNESVLVSNLAFRNII